MSRYEHLPIYKKMFDFTVYIEKVVKNFSRYNKYALGTELRLLCYECIDTIILANSVKNRKEILIKLRILLEKIKIRLIIAKELKAFNNKNSFFYALNSIVEISKQNEGWIKSVGKNK